MSEPREPQVGLDAAAKARRDRRLQATYGISETEYERLLHLQHGRCAICQRPYSDAHPLIVDHQHLTGVVRGLLCSECNTGIGLLDDSPVLLAHALVYLHERGSYAAVTGATFIADEATPPEREPMGAHADHHSEETSV